MTTVTHATFTDLLSALFPADTDGYLKVATEGTQRAVEYWFRRSSQGTWLWQRQYGYQEPPTTVEQFLAANAADVSFSPLRWAAPTSGSAVLPPTALWAGLRLGLLAPTATTLTLPRADVASAELARQRLAEFSPTPSIIVHEGNRIVGLWLVHEPLTDLTQVDRALRALARALGADYAPPQEALLAVPGTRTTRLHPAHTVEIVSWEPERRYTLDRLALP